MMSSMKLHKQQSANNNSSKQEQDIKGCKSNAEYFEEDPPFTNNPHRFHQFVQTLNTFHNLNKRGQNRPKTLKEFKDSRKLAQKYQRKSTQKITPFVQPDIFAKTFMEEQTNTIKINQVKYYSCTKKGLRNYQTLQNQDVLLIERIANMYKLFAIFDGHGQHGKSVANSSASYFKSCLKTFQQQFKRQLSNKQLIGVIKNCIKKTQSYLHNYKYNEIQLSGTTALIVLVSSRNIFTFNIGNSRLVIAMKGCHQRKKIQVNNRESCLQQKKLYDFQVTNDHDLNRFDERIRIKEHGAIISPLKDQFGQCFGPDRLWNKDESRPGTFITRALGLACGAKAGIISQPQVSCLNYSKRMKYFVLASDGLWFVQQNDEVIQYLNRYYIQSELSMGVPALMEEAINRWKSKTQMMDDISIIVVTLTDEK